MHNFYTNRKLRSNNYSGVTGVSWNKSSMKWIASIKYRGKSIYIGAFQAIDDAITARKKMEVAFNALKTLDVKHFDFIKYSDKTSSVRGYLAYGNGFGSRIKSVISIEGPTYDK